jgi:hypothetical protein
MKAMLVSAAAVVLIAVVAAIVLNTLDLSSASRFSSASTRL